MMTLIKSRLWCAFLIFTAQCAVQAQTLIGFDFNTSNYPAWDVSGAYQLDQPIDGAGNAQVPLTYTVYITHSSKGKLSGSGTIPVNIDGQVVAANYKLNGTVSGGGNNTRVNFSVSFRGEDGFYGNFQKFNAQVNYKLNVNPTDFTLVGKAHGNITIGGAGNQIKADVVLPLPTGVSGAWSVNMGLTPLNQFIGTGMIDVASYNSPETPGGFPNTRVLVTDVSGSYNNSKMVANTNLKGVLEDKGSDLNLKIQLTDEFPFYEIFPKKMSGKVLGQKIKFSTPTVN